MSTKIPECFRGYVGDPQSELEVAYLLGLLQSYLPIPLAVTAINDTFPDCEGINPTTGRSVRIELEVLSRNFLSHGHDAGGCDYIVCWKNNWQDAPVPVIALEEVIRDKGLAGKLFHYAPRASSLREKLQTVRSTDSETAAAVSQLLDVIIPRLAKTYPELHVDDTLTKHFIVRHGTEFGIFGVYPDGKLVCSDKGLEPHFVGRFGDKAQGPSAAFRSEILAIGFVRTDEKAELVGAALWRLMDACS